MTLKLFSTKLLKIQRISSCSKLGAEAVPYASRERQRQAARESARRRRAARRGATPERVEPLNRSLHAGRGLSPADLARILSEEIAIIRDSMRAGNPERARVLVALCTCALRCFETCDLAARVEMLERTFEELGAGCPGVLPAV